jgi:hypothetical protein
MCQRRPAAALLRHGEAAHRELDFGKEVRCYGGTPPTD